MSRPEKHERPGVSAVPLRGDRSFDQLTGQRRLDDIQLQDLHLCVAFNRAGGEHQPG
jgi:hypothetical protein